LHPDNKKHNELIVRGIQMKIIEKLFKWVFITILALFSLTVAAAMIVAALDLTLNLNQIRPAVETALSTALNRKVQIRGSVSLKPTLSPTLEIRDVQIDNPEGWTDPVFMAVELARVQVGIPALFNKQIDIGEITAEQVILNLESNKKGKNNWQFDSSKKLDTEPEDEPADKYEALGIQALDKLSLHQIRLKYRDSSLDKELTFALDELSGTAQQGEPLQWHGKGNFQKKEFNFTIESGALEEFHPRKQLYPLSITGTIADSPFTARGELGRDRNEPKLDLDLTLTEVDIGALLSWLQIAEGVDAETDELALHLNLRGDSLRQLVTESNMLFTLKGGMHTLHGAGKGDGIPIAIAKGEVSALSGKPVALNLDGSIDSTPISIAIQGMELVNYVGKPQQLPITIKVEAAETTLNFRGKLAMPISNKAVSLGMTMQGKKLDSLDQLLGIDLPPLGPYSVEAKFSMQERGYELSDLHIKVGASDLTGTMRLDMAGIKPEAEVQLVSSLLQIDDFDLGDWSPEGENAAEKEQETASEEGKPEKKETRESSQAASLLSAESLGRANAQLLIKLDKVMSGTDTLGKGRLEVALQEGRFSITPLELQLAGGMARTEFSYYPTTTAAEIQLTTTIDNLDVGILARRIKPETKMGGLLNLDISLEATAPSLDQLMANGKGHFDLAFIPENFDAGIIDLWAVNLLSALASKVDGAPTSVINCLVASFGMEDGLMTDRVIFMDTTHMSIEGEAQIDFKKQRLNVKAAPSAKKPEFFSLATPVKINGTFEDFDIGINTIRLTTTAASFVTSPIHVPLRRLFSGERPEDGAEACRQAWNNRNIKEE
jgi:uncharacterized protein involved in outer membrane biogenesis